MGDDNSWDISADGTIGYKILTSEYLSDSMELMKNSFFLHENICKAVGLPKNPEAIDELLDLCLRAVKDGISVIAVEISTNRIAGVAFNKLRVKDSTEEVDYFNNFIKNCKHPETKAILEFIVEADNLQDLFELSQADCILDIMFLSVLTDFRGKGIAKRLCEVSIEVANKLMKGENVKQQPIDGEQRLSLDPVPKAVSAIFTSFITQRIGRQLDFTIAAEKSYEDFNFEGTTFSSIIGHHTRGMTLEYKMLV